MFRLSSIGIENASNQQLNHSNDSTSRLVSLLLAVNSPHALQLCSNPACESDRFKQFLKTIVFSIYSAHWRFLSSSNGMRYINSRFTFTYLK